VLADFETGSKYPHTTQPTQLAAVVIDGRRLEIVSEYSSYINCEFDESVLKEKQLDAVADEALAVTKITLEQIKSAPPLKVVWGQFCDWVNTHNYKKTRWSAPIIAGYNNNNFDDIIFNRLAKEFGPWDDEYQKNALFHPIHNIDLMKLVFYWFENNQELNSMSMDTMRGYMGMPSEGAHNAVVDVRQSAEMLIRFLKLARTMVPKVKFKGSFGKVIEKEKKASKKAK
jgi:DNA polymerase III epsilon subunit-like protein